MSIEENIAKIREEIEKRAVKTGRKADDITLIGVTKLHSPDEINQAIDAGLTDIGENKVQELLDKYDRVKPVRWHMIGHLQRNKVKYIIDKVVLIHSVDSLSLAKEIDKRAKNAGIIMDILIQVNAAEEKTKFGVSTEEADGLIGEIVDACPNVRIRGFMCIAPYEDDIDLCRPYFEIVRGLCLKYGYDYLSMGMSNDYPVAIEEGSNMVRIGSAIFGRRDYRSEEK